MSNQPAWTAAEMGISAFNGRIKEMSGPAEEAGSENIDRYTAELLMTCVLETNTQIRQLYREARELASKCPQLANMLKIEAKVLEQEVDGWIAEACKMLERKPKLLNQRPTDLRASEGETGVI